MQPASREVMKIALPVSLEFMVMLALNFVNQIIVGGLGPIAIAAVGFAGSITFVVAVTISAIGSSVGVLAARAYGARREHELNVTVSAALTMGSLASAVFVAFAVIWPHQLLTLAGASINVADAGSEYLRLVALAVIPQVISGVFSSVLRATDHPRSPMVATFITVALNTLLGYALVYGIGPFPELGVVGAGWATLLTATMKALILWYQSFFLHHTNHWELPQSWDEWKKMAKPLFVLAIPMGLTELVWTVGLFLYNVILQRLGDYPLASGQIANGLEGFFVVASMGFASAGQTLISRAVGAQDPTGAERWLHLVKKMALKTSFVFTILYASMTLLIPTLYPNAGDEVRNGAIACILMNAVFQPFRVRNMVVAGAALPSGNDVRGIIWGDTIGSLVVGIPLAAAIAIFTPYGLIGVMFARGMDEFTKLLIFGYRARRINWTKVSEAHAAS